MMRLLLDFTDADKAQAFWVWAGKRINNLHRIAALDGACLYLSERAWREWHAKMLWLALTKGAARITVK